MNTYDGGGGGGGGGDLEVSRLEVAMRRVYRVKKTASARERRRVARVMRERRRGSVRGGQVLTVNSAVVGEGRRIER